ncbi:MAG: 4Fe-4S dicluster domain-containing protein [Nitrospirae bacterium]|nr:4Fe-4S dicluster domain-containing protein [Nitrospirota bacterium]
MSIDRRKFLKIAGLSGIGLGLSAADSLVKGKAHASEESSLPESGVRLALVIDIGKIRTDEDYKRITDACHSIHNVPSIPNTKHEVKWIWTDNYEHTFPDQTNEFIPHEMKEKRFLLLCNHCAKPPCVRVCPTKATFKRPDGIVAQDPHRCIGCRFCMAACPYGSRSFNWVDPRKYLDMNKTNPDYPTRTMGVVEKCTLCVERLARGLEPACVEVSNGAIVFGNLADPGSNVRKILSTHYTIIRKPAVGTQPSVFYVIGGGENAG